MSLISFLRRKSALLHLVWGWKDETLKTPVQLKKISQLNEFSRRLELTAQPQQKTANNYRRYCRAKTTQGTAKFHCLGSRGMEANPKASWKKTEVGEEGKKAAASQTGRQAPLTLDQR